MNEEQAKLIAERLQRVYTVGTFNRFCDEFDFDAATTEEIIEAILDPEL